MSLAPDLSRLDEKSRREVALACMLVTLASSDELRNRLLAKVGGGGRADDTFREWAEIGCRAEADRGAADG